MLGGDAYEALDDKVFHGYQQINIAKGENINMINENRADKKIDTSPVSFNDGTQRPPLSSGSRSTMNTMKDDSIEGIYDMLKLCAKIGKNDSDIRVMRSYIKDAVYESLILSLRSERTGLEISGKPKALKYEGQSYNIKIHELDEMLNDLLPVKISNVKKEIISYAKSNSSLNDSNNSIDSIILIVILIANDENIGNCN